MVNNGVRLHSIAAVLLPFWKTFFLPTVLLSLQETTFFAEAGIEDDRLARNGSVSTYQGFPAYFQPTGDEVCGESIDRSQSKSSPRLDAPAPVAGGPACGPCVAASGVLVLHGSRLER
jgi:hypothetical protein